MSRLGLCLVLSAAACLPDVPVDSTPRPDASAADGSVAHDLAAPAMQDLAAAPADAGLGDATVAPDLIPAHPAGQVSGLVAVGYGGLRIVSRDDGVTWGSRSYSESGGGDDDQLLRAVVWGNGLWIATGWRLQTSTDGVTWVDHGRINDNKILPCNVVEGLTFAAGVFYAACEQYLPGANAGTVGTVFQSADGLTWTKFSEIGNTTGHLHLNYRGGKFVAAGDTHTSFESSDAKTWTVMPNIMDAQYCSGAWRSGADCSGYFTDAGSWLQSQWRAKIARSTDGTTYSVVYTDDQMNTMSTSVSVAPGFVAP